LKPSSPPRALFPDAAWLRPRAPGKWSPAQVTEHVAIAYEVAHAVVAGTYTGRTAPRIIRLVIRAIGFNPILRKGRFPIGTKAPSIFQPGETPGSVSDVTARLEKAAGGFVSAVEAAARRGQPVVDHPFFGRVSLSDYSRLQALHTRHHRDQLV
jgi:DinB superfamily